MNPANPPPVRACFTLSSTLSSKDNCHKLWYRVPRNLRPKPSGGASHAPAAHPESRKKLSSCEPPTSSPGLDRLESGRFLETSAKEEEGREPGGVPNFR